MLIEHAKIEEIEKHMKDEKLIITVYAKFDPTCEMMVPILEDVAKEVTVIKLNIELVHEFVKEKNITGAPTYIFFKDGKELGTRTGFLPQEVLLAMVK